MQASQDNKISIKPGFYIMFACILLLLPLKWVAGWFIAVALHELSHYLVLRLCGVSVFSMQIGLSGVNIETEPIYGWRESVCALAGPVCGIFLLPLIRWFPYLTICGFAQSLFNLIPVFPLDGGRILHGIVCQAFDDERAERICLMVGRCICVLLLLIIVVSMLYYDLGLVPIFFVSLLLLRVGKQNFLAKRRNK